VGEIEDILDRSLRGSPDVALKAFIEAFATKGIGIAKIFVEGLIS
jgi:hypothetical protein